eukprot:scaffold120041_cov63-Phaeocystis_antarctica.AAC.2
MPGSDEGNNQASRVLAECSQWSTALYVRDVCERCKLPAGLALLPLLTRIAFFRSLHSRLSTTPYFTLARHRVSHMICQLDFHVLSSSPSCCPRHASARSCCLVAQN